MLFALSSFEQLIIKKNINFFRGYPLLFFACLGSCLFSIFYTDFNLAYARECIKYIEYFFCVFYAVKEYKNTEYAAVIQKAAVLSPVFMSLFLIINFFTAENVFKVFLFFRHYSLSGSFILLFSLLVLVLYINLPRQAATLSAGGKSPGRLSVYLFHISLIINSLFIINIFLKILFLCGFICYICMSVKTSGRIKTIIIAALLACHTLFITAIPQNRVLWSYYPSSISMQDADNEIKQQHLESYASFKAVIENRGMGLGAGNYQKKIGQYYYHLPKMNTMEPFSHNAFTVYAAELGAAGLFFWMLLFVSYFIKLIKQKNNIYSVFYLIIFFAHFFTPMFIKTNGIIIVLFLTLIHFSDTGRTRLAEQQ
ncbi:MAG TPA: hypothetical protein DC049_18010 [Spirochaetia bacterium]|nr:hypothetical protein [Spirochaetia bacterium]